MNLDPDPCCEVLDGTDRAGVRLKLSYRPPLAWDHLLGFLTSRGAVGVETAVGRTYVRAFALTEHSGWFTAEPAVQEHALVIEVSAGLVPVLGALLPRIRRLFDLDAQPQPIDEHLATHPQLAPLVARTPGLRVPGAMDGFELALRAVLGQQVTVKAATTLFGRFAAMFGANASTPHEGVKFFAPTAEAVAQAEVQTLIGLGLTGRRAQTVSSLAKAICEDDLRLEPGVRLDATLEQFMSIPGIGPWTAQYVAMRALRDPDAFPHTDLGLVKALGSRPKELLAAVEGCRPWRAYAALHLWNSLNFSSGG
ncbi:MAG: DNA-3-methyladenine glycosylase family protein [Panacagrimonas sp.]